MAGGVVGSLKPTPSCTTAMKSAIAFGMVIVLFGILMPDVFHAVSVFLLTLFGKGTAMLQALPTQTATVGQVVH